MRVYLSSTYIDLKRHRAELGHYLRKSGYEVVMMEEYVARDQLVEFACKGDVTDCDVYIGIFAWRYGYVPSDANPEQLSVTEMEYTAAGKKPMTRLTFLLEETARWPKQLKDVDLTRISGLRLQLKKHCSGYFATAAQLTAEVQSALRVYENQCKVQQLEATDVILNAQELGPSYMCNIKGQLSLLAAVEFIEIEIGPTPWWNTRLYLVAAYAREVGHTRGFVFVGPSREFLLVASPSEICYRLACRWPDLEKCYTEFRQSCNNVESIEDSIWRYPQFVEKGFGKPEVMAKHSLSLRDLEYELGITREAELVNVQDKNQRFLLQEVLGRQTRYVALVRDNCLESLVDRQVLSQRVALKATL